MRDHLETWWQRLRRFHHDEHGESGALSQVMVLGVGALVVVLLIFIGKDVIWPWVREIISQIVSQKSIN